MAKTFDIDTMYLQVAETTEETYSTPVFPSSFILEAKDNSDINQVMLEKQTFATCFPQNDNNSLLELKINLNKGLIFNVLKEGMATKNIKIKFLSLSRNEVIFELDYKVNYRNFSGLDGNYNETGIMYLSLFYQVTELYLTEFLDGVGSKIRLK